MFTPSVRLFLILGCLAMAVWRLSTGEVEGMVFLFIAVCLGFGQFRYGTVWLAFSALGKNDIDRADSLITKISDPSKLNSQNRAYYNWVKGAVAMSRGEYGQAKDFFELAASGALRTSNDRSAIACCLAEIAAKTGDQTAANEQLEKARSEPHKPGIDGVISDIEKMLQAEV